MKRVHRTSTENPEILIAQSPIPSAIEMKSRINRVWARLDPEGRLPLGVDVKEYHTRRNDGPSNLARRTTLRHIAVVVAAIFMVAVAWIGIEWKSRSGPLETAGNLLITPVDGSLSRLDGSRAQVVLPGERLESGQILRADSDSAAVALVDGSRVELRSQAEFSVERDKESLRIRLRKGSIIVNAAKQVAGHLYVETKDVAVSVVGTVFFVSAEKQGSRVAVIEGQVRAHQGNTEKDLLPGDQITTTPLLEQHTIAEDIAWSRSAREHIALLSRLVVSPLPIPQTDQPAFEVASVRPSRAVNTFIDRTAGGRFVATGVPLRELITQAYGVRDSHIIGGPGWIQTDNWDIEVRPKASEREAPLGPMLQSLIETRFQLKHHSETRQLPVYELTLARGGSKLKASAAGERQRNRSIRRDLEAYAWPMSKFIAFLSAVLDKTVIDKTGLTGVYDIRLQWSLPSRRGAGSAGDLPPVPAGDQPPTLSGPPVMFEAMEDQLGLRLESKRAPVQVLVIDSVQKPSEN